MTRRGQDGKASARKIEAFISHFSAGVKLHAAGHHVLAEAELRKALTFNPKDAIALTNLGVVVYEQGRVEESIKLHRKSVALDPNAGIAHNNLGVSLNAMYRYPEAVAAYARAVELDPNNAQTLSNYGDALTNSGRYAESVPQLLKALAIRPDYAEAYSNLGMSFWCLGQLDDAIAALRKALDLNPSLAMARKNFGSVLLMCGQFTEGWQQYDYRWTADNILLRYVYPLWTGRPVDGEVLIWGEQGPGDEILHASMMGDLVAAGIRVVWECDPRLAPLFQRSYPTVRLIPRRTPQPNLGDNIKAHLPGGSVGHIVRFDRSRFPLHRRAYLEPDVARAAAFRAKLGLKPGEKLVGISWLSKNVVFGEKKSTALAAWVDILRTPGCRFVDLQYGDTVVERQALARQHGAELLHVDGLDLRDDLDGLAALVSACDLVITVSNTTAHVAGAVGTPVWILVASGGGKLWYWGTEKDDVPVWYPVARIIRQRTGDPWAVSLKYAADALAALTKHA